MTNAQTSLALKESNLIAAIEEMLPDFARACRKIPMPQLSSCIKMLLPLTIRKTGTSCLAWR
jgi:hypothetical protein